MWAGNMLWPFAFFSFNASLHVLVRKFLRRLDGLELIFALGFLSPFDLFMSDEVILDFGDFILHAE